MTKTDANTPKKSFLLLQGVASPFFNQLEQALVAANQRCLKINFCGGDLFAGEYFRKAKNHINFQGSLDDLKPFYNKIYQQYNITDIALFGDTRPIHRDAIALAKQQNINIHVFEEGYFRPHWVTLDRGGVNAFSSIYKASKNQAEWFLKHAHNTDWQAPKQVAHGNLLIRGWHDIRFHLASLLFKKKFPHYKTHRPDSALAEYWGFVRRIPLVHFFYNDRSNQVITKLLTSQTPYYLLPLQLEADSQIRLHSSFKNLAQIIETTLISFARKAPSEAKLVIKLHPLDPWFINYRNIIEDLCNNLTITKDRIIYLEGGNLDTLLNHCQGTVLVNSTVGTSALAVDCPVIALGSAIYNIDGLTFQGSLDDFWRNATPPNKALFDAFRQCYIRQTQINGSFYHRQGIAMAVNSSLAKLLQN